MIPRSRNLLATGLAATLAVTLPRGFAAAVRDFAKPAKAGMPQLQLTVDVPAHWRRFLADDLADAFASRVADVFRRQGFTGGMAFVPSDQPGLDLPVLSIRLISWRIDRIDRAECTFTAAVRSDRREESLGMFENPQLPWNGGVGRRGLTGALGDAADGALRGLARQLARNGTVSGFAGDKAM
ncbi:MAG: hypothetical protein PSV13_08785 [Lacunisphaera sp.]|nr:hypothetical protein [Lacunisphaera sp.]